MTRKYLVKPTHTLKYFFIYILSHHDIVLNSLRGGLKTQMTVVRYSKCTNFVSLKMKSGILFLLLKPPKYKLKLVTQFSLKIIVVELLKAGSET